MVVFMLSIQHAQTQSNEEIFTWGTKNFRTLEDSVVSVFNQRKEESSLYWYAKFDAFIAMIEMRKGDNMNAAARFSQSIDLLKKCKSEDVKLMYQIVRNLGAVNMNIANYGGAVSAYKEALALSYISGESKVQIDLLKYYLSKAELNNEGDYQIGADRLLSMYTGETDRRVKVRVVNLLGLNARNLGKNQRAVDYFKEAILLDEEGVLEGHLEHNIANVYADLDEAELAEKYFETALSKMKSNGGKFVTLLDQGVLNIKLGRHNTAISAMELAINEHSKFVDSNKYIEIYDYLSEAYMAVGNMEASRSAIDKYRELRDENKKNLAESKRLETIRAMEFQAESIRLINLYNAQRLEYNIQRVILLALLLCAIALIGWVYFRIVKDRKRVLNLKNAALREIKNIERS